MAVGKATRFRAGQSGNPGGRPKTSREIVDLARMNAPEGLEVLLSIMRNPEARDADRLAAVRELLARGYGRPSVSIVVHAAEEAPSISAALRRRQSSGLHFRKQTHWGTLSEKRLQPAGTGSEPQLQSCPSGQ